MTRLLEALNSLFFLAVIVTLFSPLDLFASPRKPVSRTAKGQQLSWKKQDLSGTYEGRVYFGNKKGNDYIIQGPVTLEINEAGEKFTLTDGAGKQVKGRIDTWVIPEQDNLGVGNVKLDTEDTPIEIRWYAPPDRRDIFKLVRASGANRVLRFCSKALSRAQCTGRVH